MRTRAETSFRIFLIASSLCAGLSASPQAWALSASLTKKDLTVVNYEKRADSNGNETEYVIVQKGDKYYSVRKADWYAQGNPDGKISAQVKGPSYNPAPTSAVPITNSAGGKSNMASGAGMMPPMPPGSSSSKSRVQSKREQAPPAPEKKETPQDTSNLGPVYPSKQSDDLTDFGFPKVDDGRADVPVPLRPPENAVAPAAAAPAPKPQVADDRSNLGPVYADKTVKKDPWDFDALKTESSNEYKGPYRLPDQAKPAGETPLVQEVKTLRTDGSPVRDAPGVVRGGGSAQQVYADDFSAPSHLSEVNINGTKQTGYIVTKGNSKDSYFVSQADWEKGVKSEGAISATPLNGQNKTDYQSALKDNDATLARLKGEGREYYDPEFTQAQNDRLEIESKLAKQKAGDDSLFDGIGKPQPATAANAPADPKAGPNAQNAQAGITTTTKTFNDKGVLTSETTTTVPTGVAGQTPSQGATVPPGTPTTPAAPGAPQKFVEGRNYAGYEYATKDGVPTLTKDGVTYIQNGDGWTGQVAGMQVKATGPNGGFLPAEPDAAMKTLGGTGTASGGGALRTNGLVEGKEFKPAGEWKPGNKAYDAADKAATEQVEKEFPHHGEVDEYPPEFYTSRKDEIMAEAKGKYDPNALVATSKDDYRSVVVPTKNGKEFEVAVRDGKVYQQNPTNGEMIELKGVTPESLQTDSGRAKAQSQLATNEQLDPLSNVRGKSDEVDEDRRWRDKRGNDKECDVSSVMGMKTSCKATRTTVQVAQMSNQLTQMAGSAAVTVQGQVANQKAANEGTQEASLRAAAQQAKFAGMKDMGLGTLNSGFGIYQAMKAHSHGKQEKEFDATATAAEKSGILGTGDKAGTKGDGRGGNTSQGFIAGSEAGLTQKFVTKYELNTKYTPLTVDVERDCADKKGLATYDACIKGATAKRQSQYDSKAQQMAGAVSDKASTGAGEQAEVKDQAKSGAMMSGITGVSQLITGFFSLKAAKDYEKAAAELEAANRAAIPPAEFDNTPANPNPDPRSPFTTPKVAGESGLSDNTNMADGIPPMDPGFDPGGGGGGGVSGPGAAPFELAKGGNDAGGGKGAGGLGAGAPTGAVPVEKEPGTQLAMEERGRTYLETGGGSKGGAARPAGGSDGGNSGLAELFNKLFPPDDASKNHQDIEKQASRGLASSGPGSLLGKEVNIFGRITDRYRDKHKSGAVGI